MPFSALGRRRPEMARAASSELHLPVRIIGGRGHQMQLLNGHAIVQSLRDGVQAFCTATAAFSSVCSDAARLADPIA